MHNHFFTVPTLLLFEIIIDLPKFLASVQVLFERGAGSDAPCSRSGGEGGYCFQKEWQDFARRSIKEVLQGPLAQACVPWPRGGVSHGPGEGGLARGSPLAKQASGQSKKRDGQKVARASYSTLGVSRPRVPIPGVPIPGVSIAGVPPQKTLTQIPFSYQHPAPRSWGKAGLWPC